MRTFHWVALIGTIAAAVIACSSSDDSTGGPTPGSGGSVIGGKGGASNKGGAAGSTAKGGSSNEGGSTAQGGSSNEGGSTAQGGSTAEGGAAGSTSCDPSTQYNEPACDTCMNDACATEGTACQNSTACMAIINCMKGCGTDDACTTKCFTDNPDGQQPLFAYFGCTDTTCHDECYCPVCRFGSTASCNSCLSTKCTAECGACDKNADCMAMVYCFQYTGCYDLTGTTEQQACLDACAQKFQGGVQGYNTFGECFDAQCTTDCQ